MNRRHLIQCPSIDEHGKGYPDAVYRFVDICECFDCRSRWQELPHDADVWRPGPIHFHRRVSFYTSPHRIRPLPGGRNGNKITTFVAGSSVELTGLTNTSSGLFNVSLSSANGSSITNTYQLSGLSSLLSPTTLFYACGLNDTATHMLTITNVENKTLVIDGLNVSVVSGGKRYV